MAGREAGSAQPKTRPFSRTNNKPGRLGLVLLIRGTRRPEGSIRARTSSHLMETISDFMTVTSNVELDGTVGWQVPVRALRCTAANHSQFCEVLQEFSRMIKYHLYSHEKPANWIRAIWMRPTAASRSSRLSGLFDLFIERCCKVRLRCQPTASSHKSCTYCNSAMDHRRWPLCQSLQD